jgi:hypothetical protein
MSKDTFKEKTCQRCVYRVGSECRRHPPVVFMVDDDSLGSMYPPVEYEGGSKWNDACGEYEEEQ